MNNANYWLNKVNQVDPLSSEPYVWVYTEKNKSMVEKYFEIKLESDDEIKLGLRFVKIGDIVKYE